MCPQFVSVKSKGTHGLVGESLKSPSQDGELQVGFEEVCVKFSLESAGELGLLRCTLFKYHVFLLIESSSMFKAQDSQSVSLWALAPVTLHPQHLYIDLSPPEPRSFRQMVRKGVVGLEHCTSMKTQI